ncbi:MAG: uracil-DNA glycosylase family protein [Candidatus Dormibacteria bacterium]
MIPAPSDPSPPGASLEWSDLHRRLLGCERCVLSGHIPFALPMFQGVPGQRLMLVGQAPGERELGPRKPFAGRSGAELTRWAIRAGFRDDDQFRTLTYITSVTKCFPGKARSGGGDRRPSGTEVAQCRPWLQSQLGLVQPRLLLLVGGLAHDAFEITARRPLESLVGTVLDRHGADHSAALLGGDGLPASAQGPFYLPLPHPSGASRWLNLAAHREQLDQALQVFRVLWPVLVGDSCL